MRFRPRHYALFALLVAVFVFNLIRNHRARTTAATPIPIHTTPTTPPADTPAWRAFDHAAGLRNAPDTTFQPALEDLRQQLASSPTTDLKGCLTWLEFYRQGVNHPSRDPAWKDRSQHHLDGCTKYHQDTTL